MDQSLNAFVKLMVLKTYNHFWLTLFIKSRRNSFPILHIAQQLGLGINLNLIQLILASICITIYGVCLLKTSHLPPNENQIKKNSKNMKNYNSFLTHTVQRNERTKWVPLVFPPKPSPISILIKAENLAPSSE